MYGISLFFGNRLLGRQRFLMDTTKDPNGGGGGGGGADPAKDLEAEKAKNADLQKQIDALKAAANPPPPKKDDDDLATKAAKERAEKEKKDSESKVLESAMRFNLTLKDWATKNASLLPKTIDAILTTAEKEVYGSQIEKANAIKVGVVSEFFSIQSNLDLLTDTQKIQLEDFKKLAKTDKQDRVSALFDNIFEPTFEALKKIKKAEHLSKGLGDPADSRTAYNNKMISISRKHHLKETT